MQELPVISSDAELDAVLLEIDGLMHAELGAADGERLDALVTIAHAYEHEHHAIEPASPEQMAVFLAEQETYRHRSVA